MHTCDQALHSGTAGITICDHRIQTIDIRSNWMNLFLALHFVKISTHEQPNNGNLFIRHAGATVSARDRKEYLFGIKPGFLF